MKTRIAIVAIFVLLTGACIAQQQSAAPAAEPANQKQSKPDQSDHGEKTIKDRINLQCQASNRGNRSICGLSTEDLKKDALSGDCGHLPIYLSKHLNDALAIYTPDAGEEFILRIVAAPDYPHCQDERKEDARRPANCKPHPFSAISGTEPKAAFWFTGALDPDVEVGCIYRLIITFPARGKGGHEHEKQKDYDPHIIVGG